MPLTSLSCLDIYGHTSKKEMILFVLLQQGQHSETFKSGLWTAIFTGREVLLKGKAQDD
jgi:hypothetical protein